MITKRKLLTDEYTRLLSAYESAHKAYCDLIDGKITAYSLGNRSITRAQADLKTLNDFIDRVRLRMCEIEATLSGKPVRGVSRHVFVNPSLTFWGQQ